MLFAFLLSAAALPINQAPKLKAITGPLDYPTAALVKGEQGDVYYQMTIRADGKPLDCTITTSSGSNRLDKATCAYARKYMIFEPARDAQGLPVRGTYNGRLVWSVPQQK